MPNSLWNTTIVHNYNSVISVVILAPVCTSFVNLEPTWVFKLIYLFFLSLVPLGIYQICSRQIDSKISFLAAFFLFMSVFTFFIVLISLGRHEVAEVFLVLIILVIVSKPNNPVIISILCIIFGAALIFSHYSISFIFLFFLAALLILFLSRKTLSRGSPNESENTNELIPRRSQTTKSIPIERNKVINITFVAFYIILWFTWYIWNAGSSVFVDVIRLGDHIANTFVVEFMSLTASQALWLMATVGSPAHEIVKYLNLFTIFLISVGTLYLLFEWRKKIFTEEFASLAVASFIMAAIAIPIPYLAKTINTERIYHLSLVFLAPFCITGLIIIVNFFLRRYRSATGVALKTMAIFLGVFLIFNSGFVHEITRDYTFMGSLLQQSIKEHGTIEEKAYFYNNSTPEEEVYSAKWLSANRSWLDGPKVYATFVEGANVHVLAGYGMVPQWKIIPLNKNTQNIGRGEYVYLGYINVVDGVGTMVIPPTFLKVETFNIQELNPLLEKTDRIYSNNESELFVMP